MTPAPSLPQVAELIATELNLDPATVDGDLAFRSLPVWDSMGALSVIAAVDMTFGVDLGAEDLRRCQTVADLHELIAQRS